MTWFKNPTFRPLIILTILAVVFNVGKVLLSGRITELYLSWNIFLGLLPLAVSGLLVSYAARPKAHILVLVFGGLVWLALFPNAPYLLTDFMHVRDGGTVFLWYNILMFFAAAWACLLAGFYSLEQIQTLLRKYMTQVQTWIILVGIFAISSFGIYIGRFLRWNSWDVVINPQYVIHDAWIVLTQPHRHYDELLFTSIFFVFMLVSYIAWRSDRTEV